MNILWEKPDGTLAFTSILDGGDPVTHADELKSRGDIPADWTMVATNIVWPSGTEPMENYTWNGNAVVVRTKSQTEINADMQYQIDQIEIATLMNRATREFMLLIAEQQGAASGLTPSQLYAANPAYKKVKDIDNQIVALRSQII